MSVLMEMYELEKIHDTIFAMNPSASYRPRLSGHKIIHEQHKLQPNRPIIQHNHKSVLSDRSHKWGIW